MEQKTLVANNREDLQQFLLRMKKDPIYRRAKDRLLIISEPESDHERLQRNLDTIRSSLTDLKIAGLTTSGYSHPSLKGGNKAIYSFFLFEESKVDVFHYSCRKMTPKEAGERFLHEINRRKDVAGVMVFSAGVALDLDVFLDTLSSTGLPVLGAEAAVMPSQSVPWKKAEKASVLSDSVDDSGIVAVLFSGISLKIHCEYDMGWKPIGKEMKVTKTDGLYCVSQINGLSAVSIYQKYLGVTPDRYFVDNVCEFPIITTKGMLQVARCPVNYDRTGKLYFSTSVREGSPVRLSYANSHQMSEDTLGFAASMGDFQPQALFLIICRERERFLGDLSINDVNTFRKVSKQLSFVHSFAAIMQDANGGGVLNSALVAVGMREGKETPFLKPELPKAASGDSASSRAIPLNERMATFLEETTKELEEMAIAADAANREKSTFLSNMSHEIRTPINAVLGMNEMILRESHEEQILSYARDVEAAGVSLLGLINDILDFSKIEAGKMDIIPVDYEPASLLNDLINMIEKRARDKGLSLNIEVDENLPKLLHGDEVRIKQIITNLLTNAVKYTKEGTVTLKVEMQRIKGRNPKEQAEAKDKIKLVVRVMDTGIGIKEEDIEKLFKAFERIEEKRNRTIEGTGLGINITEQLLRMMGSRLEVESTYGEGSTFGFSLVQKVVNWEALGDFREALKKSRKGKTSYHEKFTAPEAKILAVDDTAMNLTVFTGLLKKTQVQIKTASSGAECLSISSKEKFDLIFLDHRMPDKDGAETLQELKADGNNPNRDTPAICLTADAVSGAREKYLSAGFDDYLTKPVDPDQLENALISFLPPEKVRLYDTNSSPDAKEPSENQFSEGGSYGKASLPDLLSSIDSGLLDIKSGITHCGSEETYLATLKTYTDSIIDTADEIERYYNSGDWKLYTVRVHALKSTSRMVGIAKIGDLAESLEHAGDEGDIEFIRQNTENLLKDYRSYQTLFSPIFEKKDDAMEKNLPLITDEELISAYGIMAEFATNFDYESLVYVMESLDDYRFPDAECERHKILKSAVARPDWDKIQEILAPFAPE